MHGGWRKACSLCRERVDADAGALCKDRHQPCINPGASRHARFHQLSPLRQLLLCLHPNIWSATSIQMIALESSSSPMQQREKRFENACCNTRSTSSLLARQALAQSCKLVKRMTRPRLCDPQPNAFWHELQLKQAAGKVHV